MSRIINRGRNMRTSKWFSIAAMLFFVVSGVHATELINVIQWSEADGGNGHAYGVLPLELYWIDARDTAMSLVLEDSIGYLATVTSGAENTFIRDSVIHGIVNPSIMDGFWIGGYYADCNDWNWITGEPWLYTNWASGEPNHVGIELAVLMWCPNIGSAGNPGEWVDASLDSTVNPYHRFWAVVEFGGGYINSDLDLDGSPDSVDNCLGLFNPDQANSDTDEHGDACDNCPVVHNPDQIDTDGDDIGDSCDNCPSVTNYDQVDTDNDGMGDSCDDCTDTDEDGYGDPGFPANTCVEDNCPYAYNPDQADSDSDGVGDSCDNCLNMANLDQEDFDVDGIGDSCDFCTDTDGDGYGNPGFPLNTCEDDNCAHIYNPDQVDSDGDGVGDVCVTCCRYVGDIDHSGVDGYPNTGVPNINDLVFLVTYMFQGGDCDTLSMCNDGVNCSPEYVILPETDFNCDGSDRPDIVDLVAMIQYMFGGGGLPSSCWDQVDPDDWYTWIPACNRP